MNEQNPYEPPQIAADAVSVAQSVDGKDPFALQAAKFSLYSPFIMFLLGCVLRNVVGGQHVVATVISAIVVLTTLAAFVMGFVGVVLGTRLGRTGIIVRSIGGIFLNGVLISIWVVAIFAVL